MYNNQYVQPRAYIPQNAIYEQNMYDQIDNQIKQLQQMREQVKSNSMPPAINQTFQISPSNHTMKFANTIDEVNKEVIFYDTPFFSKDMSVLWVKDTKGNVKTYELNEIIPRDEKDIKIEMLQAQINEMKGMINNAKSNNEHVDDAVENEESTDVPVFRTSKKKQQ